MLDLALILGKDPPEYQSASLYFSLDSKFDWLGKTYYRGTFDEFERCIVYAEPYSAGTHGVMWPNGLPHLLPCHVIDRELGLVVQHNFDCYFESRLEQLRNYGVLPISRMSIPIHKSLTNTAPIDVPYIPELHRAYLRSMVQFLMALPTKGYCTEGFNLDNLVVKEDEVYFFGLTFFQQTDENREASIRNDFNYLRAVVEVIFADYQGADLPHEFLIWMENLESSTSDLRGLLVDHVATLSNIERVLFLREIHEKLYEVGESMYYDTLYDIKVSKKGKTPIKKSKGVWYNRITSVHGPLMSCLTKEDVYDMEMLKKKNKKVVIRNGYKQPGWELYNLFRFCRNLIAHATDYMFELDPENFAVDIIDVLLFNLFGREFALFQEIAYTTVIRGRTQLSYYKMMGILEEVLIRLLEQLYGSIQELTPSEAQLNFFGELGLNIRKAGSSTSTMQMNFDKILVVGCCYSEARQGPEKFLCRTDLSSDREGNDNSTCSLRPILHFCTYLGRYSYRTISVVGSLLFMIGGKDHEYNRWMSEWCWYDFRDAMCSGTTTFLEEKDLKMGPPMKGRKNNPIAAVVSGYMICVFSSTLYDKNHCEVYDENKVYEGHFYWGTPNFEVFDTTKWSWTVLPELVNNYKERRLDKIRIWSYCIEGSCLIVCSDIGIYGIDVGAEELKWVKMEGSERIERSPFSGRWAMVGYNVCSPFEVGKWGEAPAFGFKNVKLGRRGALCSQRDENGVILCRVTAALTSETRVPVLSVSVAKFDDELLERSSGDMMKSIQSDKTCSYEIEYQSCFGVDLDGCWFQLKEVDEFEAESRARSQSKMVGTAAVVGSLIAMLYYIDW